MIDWMNKKAQKTEEEVLFDSLCEDYLKLFGEYYPLNWGVNDSITEDIETIKNCLKTGEPVKKFKYDTSGGKVY